MTPDIAARETLALIPTQQKLDTTMASALNAIAAATITGGGAFTDGSSGRGVDDELIRRGYAVSIV